MSDNVLPGAINAIKDREKVSYVEAINALNNVVGQGFQPQEFKEPLAKTVRIQALRYRAKADVLEYMEAQLSLDLFKSDPLSADLFERTMRAALAEINKL